MIFYKLFSSTLFVIGAAIAVVGTIRHETTTIPISASIIAGLSLISYGLIMISDLIKGVHRIILIIFFFSMFMSIYYPFMLLNIVPELLLATGLENIVFDKKVSTIMHIELLIYTWAVGICFSIGCAMSYKRLILVDRSYILSEKPTSYKGRIALLLACSGLLIIQIILIIFLGRQDIYERNAYGMYIRFIPSTYCFFLTAFIFYKYRNVMKAHVRFLCFGNILLYLLLGILGGHRGVIMSIPLYIFFMFYILNPSGRLTVRFLSIVVLYVLCIIPISLAITVEMKNVYQHDGIGKRHFHLSEVTQFFTDQIYVYYFFWFSGRFQGYQTCILVMEGATEELNKYADPFSIATNIVQMIIPDRFLPESFEGRPSLGKLAGVVLGNARWDQSHAGVWYGIPMLWVYFLYWGPLVCILWGFISGKLPYWLLGKSEVLSIVFIVSIIESIWMFHISGSVDTIIAQWITNTIIFVIIYQSVIFLFPVRNRVPQPRLSGKL